MAQRRMFSKRIVSGGKFLKMPVSSQALYFHLAMNADDDGIVEAFQVIRQTGANEDDLKVLASKEYVRVLNEDLVTFVTDWKEHNLIRADRKVNSMYQKLLVQLLPETSLIEPKPRADTGKPTGRPLDGQMSAQDRIGKVRIENTSDDVAFSLKDEIQKLEESPQRHINIIAFYLDHRQPDLRNKGQFKEAIERHMRAARSLIHFTDDQLVAAVPKAKKITSEWTLDTLKKILTK